MKNMKRCFLLFGLLFLTTNIFSQSGTYYDAINTNSANFITDLENRIRSPYTQISYDRFDETNVANFSSRNNGNGTRSVFCVYSNYEHVYSGTFSWGTMSREHTYAASWQPANSESRPEYSDHYHLFPTQQNDANGIRGHYPLGNVVMPNYTFLESKRGTDANGNIVFEPRDEHKGDAARALLYMPIRYDGINGYDWSFNWLNNTRLPTLNPPAAPQSVATLLEWHKQDPPDKWEIDRNNYTQSVQQNRNPFVDHPEYVNYINFNNLSKLSPVYATEPTNYPSAFSAASNASGIAVSWTDASAGTTSPDGYLIIAYNRNNYFLPIDGEVYTDDSNFADGLGIANVAYSGSDSYTFTNLANNTTYYFTIFSYTGSGTLINYKINGTFVQTSAVFNGALATEPTNHVTGFSSGTITSSSISLNWTDAIAGTQAPSGYILLANQTGTFSNPSDGIVYSDDTNLGDGSASVNISYSAANTYTFSGLSSSTTYYFKIFSYNGDASSRNYKTDGSVPVANATTESGSALATEPTNYVTNFSTGEVTSASIPLNWADALAGTQAPSGYLILANQTGTFSSPTDATVYLDDTNLNDGFASVNISFSAANTYTFSGLSSSTTYYFKIFSYNGDASSRNYKTDGSAPVTNATTESGGGGALTDLVISEYIEGTSNNKAIEIFNGTSNSINLTSGNYVIQMFMNGSSSAGITITMSGTIAPDDVFVLANSSADGAILSVADQTNGEGWYSGDDAVVLRKGGSSGTILDVIGQVGFDPGSEWGTGLTSTADNTLRRNYGITTGDTNPSDAFNPSSQWTGYATNTFDGLGVPYPLPVELTSFSASVSGSTVKLNWQTATEVNNYGFEIQRLKDSKIEGLKDWEKVGFVAGNGNSNSEKSYSFTDDLTLNLNHTLKAQYRLKQIDNDGQFDYSKVIEVTINKPDEFTLEQNYPNPFNPITKIRYGVPSNVKGEMSKVTLKIYDILGNEVATLVNEAQESGNYEVNFSLTDGTFALPSGVYFYRLQAGDYVNSKKMIILK